MRGAAELVSHAARPDADASNYKTPVKRTVFRNQCFGAAWERCDDAGMFAVALFLAIAGTSPAVVDAWAKLQPGMSRAKVTDAIGSPLLRNAARGHELWIYDAGAEVVFFENRVTAWTPPKTLRAPASDFASERVHLTNTTHAEPDGTAKTPTKSQRREHAPVS